MANKRTQQNPVRASRERLNFETIKSAALASIDSVLARWVPNGKRQGKEYVALNPNRSDAKPGSFSINTATGAWADFATGDRGGDVVSLVAFIENCSQVDAARQLSEFLGLARDQVQATAPPAQPAEPQHTVVMPIPDDAPKAPTSHPKHGKPVHVWTYRDDRCRPLSHVLRFDVDGGKQFLPLSLWLEGGEKRWRWKAVPEPRPLYGLDRLAERGGAPVLIVEGEKAADAAAKLLIDYCVLTSSNGAKSAAKSEWSPVRGRRVVIWPDADNPGTAYAAEVSSLVKKAGAHSVATLRLEALATLRGAELPAGWDAADALAEGIDVAALARVIGDPANSRQHQAQREQDRSDKGTDGKPVSRYVLIANHPRKPGVYFIPVAQERGSTELIEGEPTWICSPLSVAAVTRDSANSEWGRLLVFPDRDGIEHRWAMPMTMLGRNGDDLIEELLRQGLEVVSDRNKRKHVLAYIQGSEPGVTARCVTTTGWHGSAFVLPDRTIGESQSEPLIFQTAAPDGTKLGSAGTLADWQQHIAAPCANNSRLVLVLSMGFAAACMGLTGAEGGGLHLRGKSSAGKSTALAVAASIFGPPSYRREFRATDNSLESIAALHSDLLLPLDEIGALEPKHAASVAYLLANGQGKSRSRRDGSLRAPAQWRLLFLSGGEIGLADLIAEAGGRHRAGMEVRVIDLPADAGKDLGIFDSVPHGVAPGAFAELLKTATAAHYGTALPAFLRGLVADVDKARLFLSERIASFVADANVDVSSGQVRRVVNRFGLIAAAGELATHLGVTGWAKDVASHAAWCCFRDWEAARGTKGDSEPMAMIQQVRHFLEQHGDARFTLGSRAKDDRAPKVLLRCGWRVEQADGVEFWVYAESFKREVCQGFDPTAVARVLAKAKALKPESDRCMSRKELLPDDSRARIYRLLPSIWEVEV
jgi:uncharacterized protein (DUF927 family)